LYQTPFQLVGYLLSTRCHPEEFRVLPAISDYARTILVTLRPLLQHRKLS
jgi:hypothetical protein